MEKQIPATKVVPIEGEQLVSLMLRHHIGIRVERKVEVLASTNNPSLRKIDAPMSLKASCRLEKAFHATSLPLTMRLAENFKASLLSKLPLRNPLWPFEDRVVMWLLPQLEADASSYHQAGGPDMAAMFRAHQLEHFDEVLSKELRRRLDTD